MMTQEALHIPVLRNEVLDFFNLKPGMCVVDATLGIGGHAEEIIKRILPGGRLIGIDRDSESIELARERLKNFGSAVSFAHQDFRNLDKLVSEFKIEKIDCVLFDLGISSFQLDMASRGFSFTKEGPLDMRMDRNSYISAYDLVNNLSVKELSSILLNFGEERFHNRIANRLTIERQKTPIQSTRQLTDVILKAVPHYMKGSKIHPATRTFQALRIAVNRELEALDEGLNKALGLLSAGGRICVISFHSLEDRIVKRKFLLYSQEGVLDIITKKPVCASDNEAAFNPRARSAKLRCAERRK